MLQRCSGWRPVLRVDGRAVGHFAGVLEVDDPTLRSRSLRRRGHNCLTVVGATGDGHETGDWLHGDGDDALEARRSVPLNSSKLVAVDVSSDRSSECVKLVVWNKATSCCRLAFAHVVAQW